MARIVAILLGIVIVGGNPSQKVTIRNCTIKNAAVDTGSPEAPTLVKSAMSLIDKAVSKGALKRRTASRYISRLARRKETAE